MLEEIDSQNDIISYYEEDSKDTILGNQNNIPNKKNKNLEKLNRKKDSNQVITLQKKNEVEGQKIKIKKKEFIINTIEII